MQQKFFNSLYDHLFILEKYSNIILYVFAKISRIFSGLEIYLFIFQVFKVFHVHGNPTDASNSILSV